MRSLLLRAFFWLAAAGVFGADSFAAAQSPVARAELLAAMKRAGTFYRQKVASHGGYVYHYSLDLQTRWGEGLATTDQIWVQPPGTPTVGLAWLAAWRATRDPWYLNAARDAAHALTHGQLKSGGWTNAIDFAPSGKRSADYRNGQGRGRNYSTLDDGITQSALRFLLQFDQAVERRDPQVRDALQFGLDALLQAQFANGGFPQVWTGPAAPQPVVRASYPDYDWRTENRIKEYWNLYTLNDDLVGYTAELLIDAHRIDGDPRHLKSLRKLGDFLILAQLPDPQPAWAQQYDYAMRPVWARKFEPPAVAGRESQDAIRTLLRIHAETGDGKYLDPIPRALAWLEKSKLPDGQLARYYELCSNRPLYMTPNYQLTYDGTSVPDHYGWTAESQIKTLSALYEAQRAAASRGDVAAVRSSAGAAARATPQQVAAILKSLDEQGRWLSTYDGSRLVGQPKFRVGEPYLSSRLFADNLTALSQALERVP